MLNTPTHRVVKTVLMVLLSISVASCGGNNTQNNNKGDNKSKTQPIKVQTVKLSKESLTDEVSDTLRFGVMRQGEQVIKDLKLENIGQTPMVLLRHVTSCGCINIEYERKPLAPEESCLIHFTYDSRGQLGWQMKLLEFYFADSATPLKLYIEAEVE